MLAKISYSVPRSELGDVVGFTESVRQLLQHEQCQPPTRAERRAQQSATMGRARNYIDTEAQLREQRLSSGLRLREECPDFRNE